MADTKVKIEEIKNAIKNLNGKEKEILFSELLVESDLRTYLEWQSEQIRLAEDFGGNDDMEWPDIDWKKEFKHK